MPQTANNPHNPLWMIFFLPDLCNMKAVLRLLVVTELLAVFLTLADLERLTPFPY